MKQLLTCCMLVLIGLACKNAEEKKDTTSNISYAYKLEKPDNWDIGSKENTAIAFNALKAFEDNKLDDCLSYFADTVRWRADYLDQSFSKDSLKSNMTRARNSFQTFTVKMSDFESVISKDKKDEWVTLWYTQIFTDQKTGKVDSLAMVNDLKIVNGKIVELNETMRHFPLKQ